MTALSPVLAVLAAVANAASNVLQRSGNRDKQSQDEFSIELIKRLFQDRIWLIGLATVLASFFIQAAALGVGQLAEVEPLVVLELPITLILGKFFLGSELHRREWIAIAVMTGGVIGLVLCLGPSGGSATSVDGATWAVATAATVGLGGSLFALARFRRIGTGRQAALLGAAAGVAFGLTSALTKGVTAMLSRGPIAVLSAWQTYLLLVFGLASMWLLQQAFNSGRLVAAQPGITLADPLVAILWGTLIFKETTNTGVMLGIAGLFALAMAAGGVLLSNSAETTGAQAEREGSSQSSSRRRQSSSSSSSNRRKSSRKRSSAAKKRSTSSTRRAS